MPYKKLEERRNYLRNKRKEFLSKYTKICIHCNNEFTPIRRIDQLYCSDKCRHIVERLILKEKTKLNAYNQKVNKYKEMLKDLNTKYNLNSSHLKLRRRDNKLKSNFGISIFEYYQICNDQNWMCPVCYKPLSRECKDRWHPVDHCHETGLIRGITHLKCNTNLGVIEPALKKGYGEFLRLIKYTNQHTKQNQ